MESHSGDMYGELRQELQRSNLVRVLRILIPGLMIFTLAFVGIILFLYFNTYKSVTGSDSLTFIMTIMHAGFLIIAITSARFVTGSIIGQLKPFKSGEVLLEVITRTSIIKYAHGEGASFFGCITLLIAVMQGDVNTQPIYWLNILTPAGFILYLIRQFPVKDKLLAKASAINR